MAKDRNDTKTLDIFENDVLETAPSDIYGGNYATAQAETRQQTRKRKQVQKNDPQGQSRKRSANARRIPILNH